MAWDPKTYSRETLSALTEASAAINSTLEFDAVLNRIAESAAEVMRAEASSVLTYDRHNDRLTFAAAVGAHGRELIGRQFDARLGIAGHVLKTGRAENIEEASRHPDFFKGIDEEMHFHTRGLIAAPMVFRSEIVGVVEVLNRADGSVFDATDLELLRVFADLAAAGAHNARAHQSLRRQNLALRSSVLLDAEIIGTSRAVRAMLQLADRVAPTQATVLVVGETGTGKEVLAKHIHHHSPRAEEAFVAVNCAALPETLLESELFGHEKGAFTGATSQRIGRFELADNGTLFLDEIGDISASTQVKLLRLLQERTFTRVGGTKTISCDVRIIAATNRDLKAAIAEGRFRDDLFYRLNVFPITVPPLRERRQDIPLLVDHFSQRAAVDMGTPLRRIAPHAAELLYSYDWPGNVRELANVIERAVLMCDGTEVMPSHLPVEITRGPSKDAEVGRDLRATERSMIVDALRQHHGNQSAAARALGISRDNLRYRVKKYTITREELARRP
jgi:Nif-specific regulatory protein